MRWMTSNALLCVVLLFQAGCSTAPDTVAERRSLEERARLTVDRFKTSDPSLSDSFFKNAKGYAVFPTVGKGAVGLGGAYGKGVLFEGDVLMGYCDLTQATVGLQLGGQAYSEVIFFEDDKALNSFKSGTFAFAAQVSAVAAAAGAGANAKYDRGVAVFTLDEKGLMYEASVGGQSFSYLPKAEVHTQPR